MLGSLLNRLRDPYKAKHKARPERFWDTLTVEVRRIILIQEGFPTERVQRLCSKRWKNLSVTERIWLFNPLLLMEMSWEEVQPVGIRLTNFNMLSTARSEPDEQQ